MDLKCNENLIDDDIWDIVDSLDEDNLKDDKKIQENLSVCAECLSNDFETDTSNGFTVCKSCGIINTKILDRSSEYINSNNDTRRYGCPTNYFLPKSSLGTRISRNIFCRISILEKWGQMPYKERSLFQVLKMIEKKCKVHNVPSSIIENAKILFKSINDSKYLDDDNVEKNIIIRGLNRKSLIAACVFHGACLQGMPRSPKEIAEIFEINEKHVTKGCRKFREILSDSAILRKLKSTKSIDFLTRKEYISKLNLHPQHISIVKKISNNINILNIASDHQPPSIAAGSILLMSEILKLNISKKIISDTFRISQVTIMKTFRKIFPYRKIVVSDENTQKVLKLINKKKIENEIIEVDSEDVDSINENDYKDSEEPETINLEQTKPKIEKPKPKQINLIQRYL